jgi:hypothetical protein
MSDSGSAGPFGASLRSCNCSKLRFRQKELLGGGVKEPEKAPMTSISAPRGLRV